MDIYLLIVILFVVSILLIIAYRIYKFVNKFNKIYKYFSEKDTNFSLKSSRSAPINGECPKESELAKL